MLIIYLAPLVALIGLVMYLAVKNNGDMKEVGRVMFFCGLLATLMLFASEHAYRLP